MTELHNHDDVRVYPAGQPDKAAVGTIVIISGNGISVGISFGETYVPFINGATGMAIHPEHGKMLLLTREGQTWNDVFSDGQFTIEAI